MTLNFSNNYHGLLQNNFSWTWCKLKYKRHLLKIQLRQSRLIGLNFCFFSFFHNCSDFEVFPLCIICLLDFPWFFYIVINISTLWRTVGKMSSFKNCFLVRKIIETKYYSLNSYPNDFRPKTNWVWSP